MDLFSISQLSQFSGIKPHTIRIWEQRYNALRPSRSGGNTRYYDNAQLRRLLNIVSLMEYDYKVSELCIMGDKELFRLVSELTSNASINNPEEYFITQLIGGAMTYDEPHFEKIFSHCMLHYGMRNTYIKVVYPMLLRIGLMWTTNAMPPAHEHYVSNLLKQKLFTAIDSLSPSRILSDNWLLFLPENEFHEIGLLFACYLIRLSGRKVIYLGSNVPLNSLLISIKDTRPDNLLFFLVHRDLPADVQAYCDKLFKSFNGRKIYVSGDDKLISELKINKKIEWLRSVESLEEALIL